ncbi:hypothetical protein AB0J35_21550 [Nonomuraea angiospora]|uniref:hypothetical protein n=1 Tax=Nonomuraea angiospora TaxID=46172 RepID=UPI003419F5E7
MTIVLVVVDLTAVTIALPDIRSGLGLGAGNVVANQVGLTAPMDRVGMATGVVNTVKQVGTAVGVAVPAAPYRAGVASMLLVAAGLALAGALLPVALLRRADQNV